MNNKLMAQSFIWMFIGLLITFATGYYVSTNTVMLYKIYSSSLYYVFAVVEIILVVLISLRISKMKGSTAKCLFILYSFISGLTFASIFLAYNLFSIFYVFIIASILFLVFGLIGYFTNLDLSRITTYLLMALIGIIICSIANVFINSNSFSLGISIVSVIVFLGFTAYDVQKIKKIGNYEHEDALPILLALNLYIDFINIFLDLLSIFGGKKD